MINPLDVFIKCQRAFIFDADTTLKITVLAGSILAGFVSPILDPSTEAKLQKTGKFHLPYPQLLGLILVTYICSSTAIGMGTLSYTFT